MDAASGDDASTSPSSPSSPLLTVEEALRRAALADPTPAIYLRETATHFLPSSLEITPAHSGLVLASYPGENAVLSGGVPLPTLKWEAYDLKDGKNIYMADIDDDTFAKLPTDSAIKGLQHVDLGRMTVARYPNIPGGIVRTRR